MPKPPFKAPSLKLQPIRAPFRTLGPGSVASLLKVALDVAYVLLFLITAALLISFVVATFVPFSGALGDLNITLDDDSGGRQIALTRGLLLFGIGAVAAYFGGFLLILRNLRQIFRTLTLGDPFQPENVRRLRQVGLILAVVNGGVWLAQTIVASRLASGVLEPQGFGEMMTPIFSILVVLVLAEVFREGARLRHESELTI